MNAKENTDESHWEIGKNYLIRTVTMIQVGTLVKITPTDFVLQNASWVADTGRFANAFKDGTLLEVEPWPDEALVMVNRSAYIDAALWPHPLPRKQR